jgi:hypothetical protein
LTRDAQPGPAWDGCVLSLGEDGEVRTWGAAAFGAAPTGGRCGVGGAAAPCWTEMRGIATTRFTSADVVRHPLVARIVEAYERDSPPEAR